MLNGCEMQEMRDSVTLLTRSHEATDSYPEVSLRRRRLLGRFLRSRRAVLGSMFLLVVALCAVFAGALAPLDPNKVSLDFRLQPPRLDNGVKYVLGGDPLGRDILSRVIYGSRISLTIGLMAVLISGAVGLLLGLIAGYYGGRADEVIMRLADIQLAIPPVLLAITLAGVMGPSMRNLILVMAITGWVIYARTIRGVVLSLRDRQFVEAAHCLGAGDGRVLFRHILPNVWTPVIVIASQQVGFMIILESSLSFLGLGMPPPTPTWGGMIANGRNYLSIAWFVATVPGVALMSTVLAVNFLGDGLRDALDPRLRL